MIDDVRDAGAASYRGFLFCDMRGFTAFAERHGNSAAAAMVGRFLEIARTAIGRYQGAEVKTEGDAIHAVFASASSAVMCGLEIVEAAAELNAREPDRPLGVGVGVHAGEAVETAEGYIGRAVNIAARLCAAAKPGEVLVSSTVKGITQASISVGFIPRGRRRLKGIQDPIVVYAVTRDPNAKGPRELPRSMVLGAAGVAAAAVLALAVAAGSLLFGSPGASGGASPGASAPSAVQPVVIGPLGIGTYMTRSFQPQITFDIGEPGWTANVESAEMLGLIRSAEPLGSLYLLRVAEVIENPCTLGGESAGAHPGAADILAILRSLPHLAVSEPTTVRVGGYVGQQLDVTVADSSLAACSGPVGGGGPLLVAAGGLAGGDVPVFIAGGDEWRAVPGERFRLIVVDVNNQAVTIVISTDWTQMTSVQELERLNQVGQRVIDSARGF